MYVLLEQVLLSAPLRVFLMETILQNSSINELAFLVCLFIRLLSSEQTHTWTLLIVRGMGEGFFGCC